MLATRWPAPLDSDNWWFEVKWDGYRAIVGGADGKVRARSRSVLDLIGPFPELASVEIPDGVVVDAGVTAFDEDGHPSFSQLQRRTGFGGSGTGASVAVNLVVFDLLFRGVDVTDLPYEERRGLLTELELESPLVVPEPTETHGVSLSNALKAAGIEGVLAKRLGSRYQPGRRSDDWRKIAVRHRLRAVVGGYLPGEGGRSKTFGSVLVGLCGTRGLRWIAALAQVSMSHLWMRSSKPCLNWSDRQVPLSTKSSSQLIWSGLSPGS